MNRVTSIAYIDLLTCLFVFFLVAFVIVFAQQKKVEAEIGNISYKAEFIVILDWPDESENDFDLWVRNPSGEVVFFRKKEQTSMTLDRDDQGLAGKKDPIRREIVSIRGVHPGEYTVNVVLWDHRSEGPEKVRVSVSKLNPFSTVIEKEVTFFEIRQEETIVTFFVDEKNRVLSKNSDPVSLITGIVSEVQ